MHHDHAPVQIGQAGAKVRPDGIAACRDFFERHDYVRLPQFFAPPVLAPLLRLIDAAIFYRQVDPESDPPSVDLCVRSQYFNGRVEFLLNDPALFGFVRDVTGCSHVGSFVGRVYRLQPGAGHAHGWHDDLDDGRRLVGLSINLSPSPYAGGVLQTRERDAHTIRHEVRDTQPGDAVLFRLAPDIEHRVTAVEGSAMTALEGWFCGAPEYALSRRPLAESPERAPDVIYVPTPPETVDVMLKLARITRDDVVYELGCGDGRLVIGAARHYGASGVGVDIDPARIREASEHARRAGVADRVTFIRRDLFYTDVSAATVVVLYLLPSLNLKLRPTLLRDLRAGSRVVSYDYDMGDWAPDATVHANGWDVHRWTIPPKAQSRTLC